MKLLKHTNGPSEKRGSAMIAALLVVFAVATLSLIHIQLDLSKAREQRMAVDTKRAFYMAESGLAEAFYGIVAGKSGNVGSPDEPARFANGIFFTTAQEEGLGRVTLTSTGLCGAGRATLAIVIERSSDSAASMGFFGDESVNIEEGATVDCYNSRLGRYVPPGSLGAGPLPTGARVGTNQSLTVGGRSGTTLVYGDARPGPSGVLVRGTNTTISGSTAPFLTATPLPAIDVPSYPSEGALETSLLNTLVTVPAGGRDFDSLHVQALTKMVIKGPARIVVDKLVVDAAGLLQIDATDGPVHLYVTEWLGLKSGSTISTGTSDPRSVSILVSASQTADHDGDGIADPPVVLKAGGTFRGTLYAPSAAMSIPSTLELFGAASAKQLNIKANARVHFDTSMLEAGADEDGLPTLVGWRLVELPNVPAVKLRYDALGALEDKGQTVTRASLAHLEIGEIAPGVLDAVTQEP